MLNHLHSDLNIIVKHNDYFYLLYKAEFLNQGQHRFNVSKYRLEKSVLCLSVLSIVSVSIVSSVCFLSHVCIGICSK